MIKGAKYLCFDVLRLLMLIMVVLNIKNAYDSPRSFLLFFLRFPFFFKFIFLQQNKGKSCARPLVELQLRYSRKQARDNDIESMSPTPFICMIRCPRSPLKEVTEQPSKTHMKEADETKKRQTKPLKRKNSREKSHVSKKFNILPGQKKLTSFFT